MSDFQVDEPSLEQKITRAKHISAKFDPSTYENSDKFKQASTDETLAIHTTPQLIAALREGKCEVDARVLVATEDGLRLKKMGKTEFLKECDVPTRKLGAKMRESMDSFQNDGMATGRVGDDYVPLLGGPFNKQLYIYDYLRMHSTAFHAFHHDPLARCIVNLKRDFTLGRGWKVKASDPLAHSLWSAFEEVNDLYNLMDSAAIELEIYGEIMLWELPDLQTKIGFQLGKGEQAIPKGLLPRVRLIDPSVIWEIITYPEDITRVLAYQWVAPTQYQIYTGTEDKQRVPTSKFIFQQIPAAQVDHWKINTVSNEKRGRSGLFPVLGYMKRLRDSVNYAIVGMQKSAAWAIDTEVDGAQEDIDAYYADQQAMGTIAPAGSEFIHSTKIKRTYLSNQNMGGSASQAFDWCLSMIAAGTGIPIGYLNTHLSGGQTRASALVATEPVTKMFEKRQLLFEQVLLKLSRRLFDRFGLKDAHIEVTFPELVVQDRSSKLKDLAMAESQGWISKERAAEIAAQELQISEFHFEKEKQKIEEQQPAPSEAPLTTPGKVAGSAGSVPPVPVSKAPISSNTKQKMEA